MLHLIKMWLTTPVMERDAKGSWRTTGNNRKGTPQGGVISPLLANLYMNRFLKYWRLQGKGEQFRAEVVAYADDFVILSRGHAAEARVWTQTVMDRIGLTLNEQKTSIRDGRTEDFDFLGYTFGPLYWWKTGRRYIAPPFEEEPEAVSDKRLCAAASSGNGTVGASSYTPQRHVARMAELLLLWHRGSDLFKSESLCLRPSSPLPSPTSHDDAFARDAPVL
jgi:RNA-directed DNA polymerase